MIVCDWVSKRVEIRLRFNCVWLFLHKFGDGTVLKVQLRSVHCDEDSAHCNWGQPTVLRTVRTVEHSARVCVCCAHAVHVSHVLCVCTCVSTYLIKSYIIWYILYSTYVTVTSVHTSWCTNQWSTVGYGGSVISVHAPATVAAAHCICRRRSIVVLCCMQGNSEALTRIVWAGTMIFLQWFLSNNDFHTV